MRIGILSQTCIWCDSKFFINSLHFFFYFLCFLFLFYLKITFLSMDACMCTATCNCISLRSLTESIKRIRNGSLNLNLILHASDIFNTLLYFQFHTKIKSTCLVAMENQVENVKTVVMRVWGVNDWLGWNLLCFFNLGLIV